MAPRFLLDTDTCIYIRTNRPTRVTERFRSVAPGSSAVSVITYGELRFGVEKFDAESASLALDRLFTVLPILPLPPEAGRTYGVVRAQLSNSGNLIGPNDLWIAAHALATNLTLVTNNEREFRRIDGLKVENWTK